MEWVESEVEGKSFATHLRNHNEAIINPAAAPPGAQNHVRKRRDEESQLAPGGGTNGRKLFFFLVISFRENYFQRGFPKGSSVVVTMMGWRGEQQRRNRLSPAATFPT